MDRWQALLRYIENGHLPIDNNWLENCTLLIQPARLNSHDPYGC